MSYISKKLIILETDKNRKYNVTFKHKVYCPRLGREIDVQTNCKYFISQSLAEVICGFKEE